MDFLLWAVRSLHVFGIVVWFGGLMYQMVATLSVAKAEGLEFAVQTIHELRRFVPFIWMCLWTVLVTGLALMLFNPKYMFLEFKDTWSILLAAKQGVFLVLAFFSFGYVRMFVRIDEMIGTQAELTADVRMYFQRMVQFGKVNIALGIIGILLASAMM